MAISVMEVMQCMNTGHDGSMSTGHANSGADMLSRLENMVLMDIMEQRKKGRQTIVAV